MGSKERFAFRNCILSIGVISLLFICYFFYSDFVYLTNDDMFLKAIVSGEITGRPNAHMIYSHYVLGIILSKLYKVTTRIPWYGLCLLGTIALGMIIVLYRLLGFCNTWVQKLIGIGCYGVLSTLILFRQIGQVQYTVVAGIAGVTAIFFAATIDMRSFKKKFIRENVVVITLAVWCYLIREKVLFMLIPFALAVWVGKYLQLQKDEESKKIIKRFLILPIVLGLVIIVLTGIERIAYSSPQWQEYKRYNAARETIIDYHGFPDYDLHQEEYQALGISRTSYVAASEHYMLAIDEHYTASAMEELATLTIKDKKASEHINEKIKDCVQVFWERNRGYMDRPVNILVYLGYVIVIFLIIVTHEYRMFTQIGLLFFARMGVWGYLIWGGRLPDRITQVLYLAELLILFAVCIKTIANRKKSAWKIALPLIIFTITALYFGIPKAQAVKGDSAGKTYFGTSYMQIKEYCENNPQNYYFIDMNSVTSFTMEVLDDRVYDNKNVMTMGSWIPNSPLMQEQLMQTNKDAICFIFQKDEETPSHYFFEYLNERYPGVEYEVIDEINTDAGFDFEVWKIRG